MSPGGSLQAIRGHFQACPWRSERIHRKRTGSAFLDLLNFRRRTHETGWKFKALFVIHHNLVVYKLWSGIPKIDRRSGAENPLGPIQEPTDVIKSQIP
jgi:hypothetical protein